MKPSPRVDYDAIAHLYDTQPYREKTVDPELVAFLEQHASAETLSVLDIGCGTGNQLVANRPLVPHAHLVGLDRFLGMLRQARSKAPGIAWAQADGGALLWQVQSFDFVRALIALSQEQLCSTVSPGRDFHCWTVWANRAIKSCATGGSN